MAELKLRVLIVDDEPPAREMIRYMLVEDSEVVVVGECSNGHEALDAIRLVTPDIIFLDIQMPEMDGLALLEACPPKMLPLVIFVTAFDRYAVKAFEYAAVDYLLKPFDHDRMERALKRAKSNLREKGSEERMLQMLSLLNQMHAKTEYLEHFVCKNNGRVRLIPVQEVDWVEAEGNYLTLHSGKMSFLIRDTMSNIEQRLNPKKFLRIHRSTLVNIDSVKELLVHVNHEEQLVILKNGAELTMSRRYRDKVSQVLGTSI